MEKYRRSDKIPERYFPVRREHQNQQQTNKQTTIRHKQEVCSCTHALGTLYVLAVSKLTVNSYYV